MRRIKLPKSVAILAALVCVTAFCQAGSGVAATRAEHAARSSGTFGNCDPNDLPGGSEGPDDDGDECNFTVYGRNPVPTPNGTGEFAEGSLAQALLCASDLDLYVGAEATGRAAVAYISSQNSPTGAAWLTHFLEGSGTSIDLGDGSPLAGQVKTDPAFKQLNDDVQAKIKAMLDSGVQNVMLDAGDLPPPNFSGAASNPEPKFAFGGTQGLEVTGNGFPQHGQWVGQLTYTIRDVYGFYFTLKFKHASAPMHYLQSVCGAPQFPGGAHWFYTSVTVTVPFQQPIG
jgi:hypothetical protein